MHYNQCNIMIVCKNYLIFCVFHNHSRHPPNYCHSQPYPCIRNDVRRNIYSCPQHIKKSAYTTHVRPLLDYSSSVWDPHTKTLKNKIEMVQRRAARFCHNDYKTIEKGRVSEMIRKLNLQLERLNIRRTNKRLTIFHKAIHKAINGHLFLPYPSGIFSQFCVALDISIAKHTIPSTPAKKSIKLW